MKQLVFIILVLFIGKLSSQNNRCYTYDNAGNRITKNICYSFRVMPNGDDVTEAIPGLDPENRNKNDFNIHIVPNPSAGYFEIRTKGYKLTNTTSKSYRLTLDNTGKILRK